MDKYIDIVSPLVLTPEEHYKEEVILDDYFCQWIRGSESIPSDVQYYGTFNGQY